MLGLAGRFGTLAVAILLAAGCATPRSPETGRNIPVDAQADYVHQQTGMSFPPDIGFFYRTSVRSLDDQQIGVIVTYLSGNPMYAVELNIFLYPGLVSNNQGQPMRVNDEARKRLLEQRVQASIAQFEAEVDGASLVSRKPVAITQRLGTAAAQRVEFNYPGFFQQDAVTVSGNLYFVPMGDWLLVYRADYPMSDAEEAEPEIQDFIDSLALPGVGQGPGWVAQAGDALRQLSGRPR